MSELKLRPPTDGQEYFELGHYPTPCLIDMSSQFMYTSEELRAGAAVPFPNPLTGFPARIEASRHARESKFEDRKSVFPSRNFRFKNRQLVCFLPPLPVKMQSLFDVRIRNVSETQQNVVKWTWHLSDNSSGPWRCCRPRGLHNVPVDGTAAESDPSSSAAHGTLQAQHRRKFFALKATICMKIQELMPKIRDFPKGVSH